MSHNIFHKNKFSISLTAIFVIIVYSIVFESYWKNFKGVGHPFIMDVDQYYSYLPATFIHHDLTFDFPNKYWQITAENGNLIPKVTYGMSLMYAPFFLVGYKIALNTFSATTGYTKPFADMVHYGSIFYVILGLFFLRLVLKRYFNEIITALTLIILFFATNLFNYTLHQGEYSHGYSFCLIAVFLWLSLKWNDEKKYKYIIPMGLVLGLLTLIRPTEIILGCLPFLLGVTKRTHVLERIKLLLNFKMQIFIFILCFIIMWLPQIIYWKWRADQFFFFSYGSDEKFFFLQPKIIDVLFSYRKGWLVYTPVMLFSLAGLFLIPKKIPELKFIIPVYIIINIYLISCWWCWWFGGSFGMRALVQTYAILAIPLAAFINFIFYEVFLKSFSSVQLFCKYIFSGLLVFFICLNMLQTYQFKANILHYEAMTEKTYWLIFGKTELGYGDSQKYWPSLNWPNYKAALKGER